MIKIIFGSVLALAVVGVLGFVGLAAYSRGETLPRSLAGSLPPCPQSPNCVCSEQPGLPSSVQPFSVEGDPLDAWRLLRQQVLAADGSIVQEDPGYLHARFKTAIFGFVDDLELRLDARERVIHVRSAARVGYSDRGLNRRRVEELRAAYRAELAARR